MTLTTTAPLVAGLAFVAYLVVSLNPRLRLSWQVPAVVCVLFLGWSVWAVMAEGPTGFWPIHTANLWGNQVWFDLLLAAGVAWTLIVPRARAAGMNVALWLPVVPLSGSIGLLAMLARLLYLEERRAKA